MENSEILLGHWLTRQGCHWVYINQSRNFAAEGVRDVKGREVLHRPDIIALIDGVGSIAIDVKQYEFKHRKSLVYKPSEDDGTSGEAYISECDDIYLDVNYVKLAWNEMLRLLAFNKISTIPTWLCIVPHDDMEGKKAFFYRVDEVVEAYSWIFNSKAEVHAVSDWPGITLSQDAAVPTSEDVFDFIIEDEDVASLLRWDDPRAYVIPRVIDLRSGSSVLNLVRVEPARAVIEGNASIKQLGFASKIAETLEIELPAVKNKRTLGTFIDEHIVRWREALRHR